MVRENAQNALVVETVVSPKAVEAREQSRDALALQIWQGPILISAEDVVKTVKADRRLVLASPAVHGVLGCLLSLSLRRAIAEHRLLAPARRKSPPPGDAQVRGLPPLVPSTSPKPAPAAATSPHEARPLRLVKRHQHSCSSPGFFDTPVATPKTSQDGTSAALQSRSSLNSLDSDTCASLTTVPALLQQGSAEEPFAPECIVMGLSTNMGQRSSMEDFAFTMPLTRPDVPGCWFKHGACFGVFDGHGGHEVAQSLVEHVPCKIQDSVHRIASSGPRQMGEILLGHERRLRHEPNIWSPSSSSRVPPNLPRHPNGHHQFIPHHNSGPMSNRPTSYANSEAGVGMRRMHSSAASLGAFQNASQADLLGVADSMRPLSDSAHASHEQQVMDVTWSWPPPRAQTPGLQQQAPAASTLLPQTQSQPLLPEPLQPVMALLPPRPDGNGYHMPAHRLAHGHHLPVLFEGVQQGPGSHSSDQGPGYPCDPSCDAGAFATSQQQGAHHAHTQPPIPPADCSGQCPNRSVNWAVGSGGPGPSHTPRGSDDVPLIFEYVPPVSHATHAVREYGTQSCPSGINHHPSAINQPEPHDGVQAESPPHVLPPHTRSQSDVGLADLAPAAAPTAGPLPPLPPPPQPQLLRVQLEETASMSCGSVTSLLDMPWPQQQQGGSGAPSEHHSDSPQLPPCHVSVDTPDGTRYESGGGGAGAGTRGAPWNPCTMEEWDTMMQGRDPGSTALVATVIDGSMFVANVGDCRLILAELDLPSGRVVARTITNDHVPTLHKGEAARLAALRVPVSDDGYVGPGGGFLQVSRSIGDFSTKTQLGEQVILSEPELHTVQLGPHSLFAVAASDGVTCAMSDDTIVNQVCKYLNEAGPGGLGNDPYHAAEQLVRYAIDSANSSDNASAVVTCFKLCKPPLPQRPRLFGGARVAGTGVPFRRDSAPVIIATVP